MLTVTTRDGSAYDIDYRDLNGNGHRLAVRRHPTQSDEPTPHATDSTWYQVNVLAPEPPCIGQPMTLVLDLQTTQNQPVVHRTGMVMSVVGAL